MSTEENQVVKEDSVETEEFEEKTEETSEKEPIPWTERTYAQSLYKELVETTASTKATKHFEDKQKWKSITKAFEEYATTEWKDFLVKKKKFFFSIFLVVV